MVVRVLGVFVGSSGFGRRKMTWGRRFVTTNRDGTTHIYTGEEAARMAAEYTRRLSPFARLDEQD